MFENYQRVDDFNIYYKVYGSSLESQSKPNPAQLTVIFLHDGPGVVDHSIYEPFWSKLHGTVISNEATPPC